MRKTLFALAIAGLGRHTNQGSSLLVMMIMGGALVPLLERASIVATDGERIALGAAGEALVDDDFSLVALKQAASRGRLEAIIGSDGRYRSSKSALEEYKASKYSRGEKKQ